MADRDFWLAPWAGQGKFSAASVLEQPPQQLAGR